MNRPQELKDIFNEFNTGTGATKVAEAQLAKWDKGYLISMYALAAHVLAYRYEEEGFDPWDDRNRASKTFSYNNRGRFDEIYKEYTGKECPAGNKGCVYYSKAIPPKTLTDEEENWIRILNSEHPTLIQSFFRGYTNVLADELRLDNSASFPYI